MKLGERTRELETSTRELEQLAYIASHDLQEPLNTVMNFVGLLQEDSSQRLDDKERKYMNYIDRTQTSIHGGFLFVWFLTLIFVGLQLAYFMRPLMMPGPFHTGERGLFIDVVLRMFGS